ncbi:ferredoxin--NADP(+) reductase [Psychromonas marina]|uniref:ferredoxin--NADP(+) reductase n=1 Tax=Psychromonas marina TaxID=88364 RepID=A0ABQ6DY87_9GAMM|nr:ferredoxin--NADP reductase [Psychromonas marina]GLS90112.1 ferredoxin--NADP(+) reductase [Psychromonas marina]
MKNKSTPHGLIEGTIVERINWTERLFSLKMKVNILPFKAGQFTKLALPTETGEWPRRAYSLVNAPHDELLEFLLVTVPDGELSPRLSTLQQGDSIYVGEDPAGFMTIDEIPDTARDLWMLSTGTAIGPFLSMLADPQSLTHFDHLVLVHAVRQETELVYRDRIAAIQKRLGPRFHYIPIVSRETVPYALTGRIPALLSSNALAEVCNVKLDPSHSFFLICGNPEMVRDSRKTLEEMGYRKHLRRQAGHFTSENYW